MTSVRTLLASRRVRLGLGTLALAIVFFAPAFRFPLRTGFGDWQLLHHGWEAARVAIERFGEAPLWDPFHCGGVTLLGHPEAQHLSPLFPLSFAAGTTLAIKVFLVLHLWAGLIGTYLLARRHHGLERAGAALAAVAWCCSGFFAWHLAGGHGTFTPFYLMPWLLLAWRASARDLRFVPAVAALMTLTLFEGGTYPLPYFVLLLAFDTLVMLGRRGWQRLGLPSGDPEGAPRSAPSAGALVRTMVLAAPLTVLLSAIKLGPTLRTLVLYPRTVQSRDAMGVHELLPMWARARSPGATRTTTTCGPSIRTSSACWSCSSASSGSSSPCAVVATSCSSASSRSGA